jgi:hypothetical protein
MSGVIHHYCRICHILKDADEFGKTANNTPRHICFKCENHKQREKTKHAQYLKIVEEIKEKDKQNKILEDNI